MGLVDKIFELQMKKNVTTEALSFHACIVAAKLSLVQSGMSKDEATEKINSWVEQTITTLEKSPNYKVLNDFLDGNATIEDVLNLGIKM
jgi:hypothetical protein